MHAYPETIIGLKLQPIGFNHGCFEIEVTGSRPPTMDELREVAYSVHPNYEFSPGAQAYINQRFASWQKNGRCTYSLGATFLYQLDKDKAAA